MQVCEQPRLRGGLPCGAPHGAPMLVRQEAPSLYRRVLLGRYAAPLDEELVRQ